MTDYRDFESVLSHLLFILRFSFIVWRILKLGTIKRLVLDVLKLHEPGLVAFTAALESIECIDAVNVTLDEVDQQTETVKIVVAGTDLNFEKIQQKLEDLHASIHSIDQVVAGKRIVESIETPQD